MVTLTNPDHVEVEAIEVKLESLAAREKRLVTLFSYGEVDEQIIRARIADLRREQIVLNDRLRALRPTPGAISPLIDEACLMRTCHGVAKWLDGVDPECEAGSHVDVLTVAGVTASGQIVG